MERFTQPVEGQHDGQETGRHMAACKFRFALEVLEGSKTISYPAMTDPGSVALHFLIQLYKINIIILLADFFSRKLSYERLTCVSKRPPNFS